MPKYIQSQKYHIECAVYDPVPVARMRLCMRDADNIASIAEDVLPHLSPGTQAEDVALFPSTIKSEDADDIKFDVYISKSARSAYNQVLESRITSQELQQRLQAVERRLEAMELSNETRDQYIASQQAQIESQSRQITYLENEVAHTLFEKRPKAMLGVLGFTASVFCPVKKHDPANTYASRLQDALKQRNGKLGLAISSRDSVRKTATRTTIAKIEAAGDVRTRDNDAHLEGHPDMLLAVLLQLEEAHHTTAKRKEDINSEEPADHCAVRLMLAVIGPEEATKLLSIIQATPDKYGIVTEGQIIRLGEFFNVSRSGQEV